jgi:arsenite methyltransferase
MNTIPFLARQFLAKQLSRPSGWFGRYIMVHFLNRINTDHNVMVLNALELSSTDRILEVGFGGAALMEKMMQQAGDGLVAGIDISAEMLAAARVRFQSVLSTGRLDLRQGGVEALPYPDASFDKACSVNTVYFWPGLADGLKEFFRVLRPGGLLVLGFVSAEHIRSAGLDQRGFKAYSIEELSVTLTAQGFRPGKLQSGSDKRGTFYVLDAERMA